MTRKQSKAKADRIFATYIRSYGRCQVAGCTRTSLQCAHWISRRYSWTRTDERNAFCLCAHHHRWFTDHPTEFGRWAISQRGEPVYRELMAQSLRREKFDWDAEVERLKQL